MKKLLIKFAVYILNKFANKWDIDLDKDGKNDLIELVDKLEQKL